MLQHSLFKERRQDGGSVAERKPSAPEIPAYVTLGGLAVLLAALVLFGILQYRIPDNISSAWGFNPDGAHQFGAALFGYARPPLGAVPFLHHFRNLLVIQYLAYAIVVIAAGRCRSIPFKPVLGLITVVSVALAILFPLSLTMDPYTYLAYGRLGVLHGLNPYLHPPRDLRNFNDPLMLHFHWSQVTAATYGPLWIFVCYLVTAVFGPFGLWWQAVVMKLIAACALVATALAGRQIAEYYAKGSGNRTLLAIGLNPLLLVEGPGGGHNDLFMVCMLLMALSLYLRQRYAAASLLLGIAVAVKVIPLLLLPWFMLHIARGAERRAGIAAAFRFALGACLPGLILLAPFWHGAATLGGLNSYTAVDLTSTEQAPIRDWLIAHHLGTHFAPLLVTVLRQWPFLAMYFIVIAWLAERPEPAKWLIGWVSIAGLWPFITTNLWFPWYFCWSWPLSLLRWNRSHLWLSSICGILALIWSLLYTEPASTMPLPDHIKSVIKALFVADAGDLSPTTFQINALPAVYAPGCASANASLTYRFPRAQVGGIDVNALA